MRRCILKRAISDLQTIGDGWTSKCNNKRGTSIIIGLKRDEIAQIDWSTSGENFVRKRDIVFIVFYPV